MYKRGRQENNASAKFFDDDDDIDAEGRKIKYINAREREMGDKRSIKKKMEEGNNKKMQSNGG